MMEGLNESGTLWAFNGADDKFLGVLRTVLKHKPDYLHFDWIVSYYYRRWRWLTYLSVPLFCLQILIIKYLFRVKLVWTLHNILPHDLDLVPVHRFCQRFMAGHCVWIRVFSGTSVAKAAQELQVPATRFRVVPEGDYTTYYPTHSQQEEARKYLGIPSSGRVLLYLGLIKPYKGVLELLEAFQQIDPPDTCLLVAGKIMDQAYGEAIKKVPSERIRLVDAFIPPSELHYYLSAADLVVLPFKQIENSGSVILAMGFSKPIVAPALGAVQERLAQQSQLLYQPGETLKEKLQMVLAMPKDVLESAGNRNFRALSNYHWGDFAALFL